MTRTVDQHTVVMRGQLVRELLDQRQVILLVHGHGTRARVARPDGTRGVIHGDAIDRFQALAGRISRRRDLVFDGQRAGVDLHQAGLLDGRTTHGRGHVQGVTAGAVGALVQTGVQRCAGDMVGVDARERQLGRDLEIQNLGIAGVHRLHHHRVNAHRRFGRNLHLTGNAAFGVDTQDGLGGDGGAITQQLNLLARLEATASHVHGLTRIGNARHRNAAGIVRIDRVGEAAGLHADAERQCGQGNGKCRAFQAGAGANINRRLSH